MFSFTKKWVTKLIILFLIMVYQNSTLAQVGITFKFANPALTNVLDEHFLEFDITAEATANSQFKIAQIYIDYNTAGFGSSLKFNGNVSITKGPILATVHGGVDPDIGTGNYTVTFADNTSSRLAIQNMFLYFTEGNYTGMGYELTNTLGTTPKVYVHVKMKIGNQTERSGISFNTQISQWDLQDFYYTTPSTDLQTNYTPVVETSTLDVPLEGIVPVELVSFNAKRRNKDVLLNWATATEVNNYGFEIERKTQDSGIETWEKIGFINGNGNSNSPKEYSYNDKDVQNGNYSYRLRQIDNDGQFEYSPIVNVEVSAPVGYELSQNYPNPFNPSTTIKFSIPEDGLVKLSLFNLLGQEIITLVEEQRQAGTYTEKFEAIGLNSGIYFYELRVNDFVQTKKMQFIK